LNLAFLGTDINFFPLTGANNDKEIRIKTRRTHVHM
jgi:hypothetical protein